MKCPKCGNELIQNFCNRCGYIEGGNVINLNDKSLKPSELEILIGDDFTNIVQNKNKLKIFILGPLYFSYMKCFILGLILGSIDIAFIYMGGYLFSNLYMLVLNFLISRLFYVTFANAIYLNIMKIKLKLKKKKKNFDKFLSKYKSSNAMLIILTLLIYISVIIFIFYAYKYSR